MALYGRHRDILLFRFLNKEIINRIITTEVDLYKQVIVNSTLMDDIYGEQTMSRTFYTSLRIPCLISNADQTSDYNEFGYNIKQLTKFSFLRDELREKDYVLEVGDIIHWNEKYWEIDHIMDNSLFMKRDPDRNKELDDTWGWNYAIICLTHLTNRERIQIEETYGGTSEK